MRLIFGKFDAANRKSRGERPVKRRRAAGIRACPSLERLDSLVMLSGIPGVQAVYAVTNDWGSGFQAELSLKNSSATSVPNWKLDFDMAANISSIWNATISSHTGNHYSIVGASWDSTLPASSSVEIGFVAGPGGGKASPGNVAITSASSGGGGGVVPVVVPNISIAGGQATASTSGSTPLTFTINLSKATTAPVTVHYATADGTAKAGTAYTAASGMLTFAPGVTQQTVMVPVKSDVQNVTSETFSLVLSNAVGGTIATSSATGTIVEPSRTSSGQFQYQVTSDWGSGLSGQITIKNPGNAALVNWSLAFDYSGQIGSIWDASIVSHAGNHYVVQNAGWNSSIAAGGTASFGFNASPGGQRR